MTAAIGEAIFKGSMLNYDLCLGMGSVQDLVSSKRVRILQKSKPENPGKGRGIPAHAREIPGKNGKAKTGKNERLSLLVRSVWSVLAILRSFLYFSLWKHMFEASPRHPLPVVGIDSRRPPWHRRQPRQARPRVPQRPRLLRLLETPVKMCSYIGTTSKNARKSSTSPKKKLLLPSRRSLGLPQMIFECSLSMASNSVTKSTLQFPVHLITQCTTNCSHVYI